MISILLDDTSLIVLILNYTQKGRASCKYGLISRLVVALRYLDGRITSCAPIKATHISFAVVVIWLCYFALLE